MTTTLKKPTNTAAPSPARKTKASPRPRKAATGKSESSTDTGFARQAEALHTSQLVMELDNEGMILEANPRLLDLLGAASEEFIGVALSEHMPKTNQASVLF